MSSRVSSGKMASGQEGMQPAVLYKLVLFAILMAVVPIGTYFGTLGHLFDGNTTYSAICAVLAANVVLVGYVIVAFREEAAPPSGQSTSNIPEKRKDK